MKTKETLVSKVEGNEKTLQKTKIKSLRPMRSLVAVRSLKPKTAVAKMVLKTEIAEKRD